MFLRHFFEEKKVCLDRNTPNAIQKYGFYTIFTHNQVAINFVEKKVKQSLP